jgi:hypothetical protein
MSSLRAFSGKSYYMNKAINNAKIIGSLGYK